MLVPLRRCKQAGNHDPDICADDQTDYQANPKVHYLHDLTISIGRCRPTRLPEQGLSAKWSCESRINLYKNIKILNVEAVVNQKDRN
jgi:hypothetical protein